MQYSIEADGLEKTFTGKHEVRALDGVSFNVAEGTVFGLLGPNGSGKTTAVRILTTILRSDGGSARVLGHDVVKKAALVRTLIGLAGQYAAVDENLTGRENLRMVGRLNHLRASTVATRAAELLGQFDLADAADRPLKTYSGGMRRRLDLAAALVARPTVLFLDEPTTGLDPQSRNDLWEVIEQTGRGRHHRAPHHPVPRGGRPAGLPTWSSSTTARSSPKARPSRAEGRSRGHRARSGARHPRRRPTAPANSSATLGSHTPDGQRLRWSRSRSTTVRSSAMAGLRRSTRRGSSPPRSPCGSPASTTCSWP